MRARNLFSHELTAVGLTLAILAGCQAPVTETESTESIAEVETQIEVALDEAELLRQWEFEFSRQRMIGDLLYDALNALQKDKLLTPVDDNAHGRYQRVLALDPGNELAQEGLQNIVLRYLALAAEASRQGRFAAAQTLLDRARFVDQSHPLLSEAQMALQREINSGDLVFELDLAALANRNDALQNQLSNIANQAKEHDAFLLITTPNDDQARWVYAVMRDSVEGYRLRANIELGSYAIVRLRMPKRLTQEQSQSVNSLL